MFWSRRAVESAFSALRAENSDLRSQLRTERAEWAAERQTLVDRLLVLSSPAALREVRRAPPQEPMPSPSPTDARPRRIHYPGYASYLRPPSPPHPSAPGAPSLSDADRSLVLHQNKEES